MLLTVLGEFVVPTGGEVWSGTVVDVLGRLGFGAGNARQALARLGHDGVIESRRHGRRTRWHLTPDGEQLLTSGAKRIYGFGHRREPWDGRWLVVVCSIPETQREKRRRLRARLQFAGFGFTTPTVAVSPHLTAEDATDQVLHDLGLTDQALVFRAETGRLSPDRDLLNRSWDLSALAGAHEGFLADFGHRHPRDPAQAFEDLLRLVHAWRRFPFIDPELPPELLPSDWPGHAARDLFADARRTWSTDALGHFKALEATHD